jgi:hypothetical protein
MWFSFVDACLSFCGFEKCPPVNSKSECPSRLSSSSGLAGFSKCVCGVLRILFLTVYGVCVCVVQFPENRVHGTGKDF